MKNYKQNADFLYLGKALVAWFHIHGRDLPFRKTSDPYKVWICEIIFQQTRIQQGLNHYYKFTERFPDVRTLAEAEADEVMLYWKGLGYYSRALNLQKAARQIMADFGGVFPSQYQDIVSLSGVGPYTAAAVSSICFGMHIPAVDGNFYRVLSRVFADGTDISHSSSFTYFSELALRMMPPGEAGTFNEAVMDLGSEICRPRNPLCDQCPLQRDCRAFQLGRIADFPVKKKKTVVKELKLKYYFVRFGNEILIRRRSEDHIWKKLYEFPDELPTNYRPVVMEANTVCHKLSHRNLSIDFVDVFPENRKEFEELASTGGYQIVSLQGSLLHSFPKPLENYIALQAGRALS